MAIDIPSTPAPSQIPAPMTSPTTPGRMATEGGATRPRRNSKRSFGANAAWLGLNVIAHNMARFSTRLGLGETLITTDTLRRRYLRVPGRLTCSARRLTLHLPRRWPWAERFNAALANLRAVVLVT